MTTFYYDKDRYGNEHCYEVDDVQKDAAERLYQMGDDAACAVTTIWENDIFGYSSLEEYVKGECPEMPTAEFEAMAEWLDGGSYPFALVRHPDGVYEAMAEKDVDWLELASEYEDFGHWRIQPCYYSDGEITPEDAEKQGMYALAAILRGESDDGTDEADADPLADVVTRWDYYPAWMSSPEDSDHRAFVRAWYNNGEYTDTKLDNDALPDNPETARILTTDEALSILARMAK